MSDGEVTSYCDQVTSAELLASAAGTPAAIISAAVIATANVFNQVRFFMQP
jgi:fructose-1,6-bisphosphatase/sedoheptulose 1,7-bisphosphatase-like protein